MPSTTIYYAPYSVAVEGVLVRLIRMLPFPTETSNRQGNGMHIGTRLLIETRSDAENRAVKRMLRATGDELIAAGRLSGFWVY